MSGRTWATTRATAWATARKSPKAEGPAIAGALVHFGNRPGARVAGGFPWFLLCLLAVPTLFRPGLAGLAGEWARPEFSHGPVIPVLSFYMFLRECRAVPPAATPVTDRWPGVAVIAAALALALLGGLAGIDDLVFYALILWTGGLILVGFGWARGLVFWPAVLHLVFMLPLPNFLYWKLNTTLQGFSSEIGVWIIGLMGVPVFLDGNVIDLGVYKLQVAEACSGLRYLFPIMSFSYVFAVLYRGPLWQRLALLLAAVPLAIGMNALRIGVIGLLVDRHGIGQAEGFLHFFEGWVVFLSSVALLFGLASALRRLSGDRRPLADAIDLDLSGHTLGVLGGQAARVLALPASPALAAAALLTAVLSGLWLAAPGTAPPPPPRASFALFPEHIATWSGTPFALDPAVAAALGADDYLASVYADPAEAAPVDLFVSYYHSQTEGDAIHSPEVCMPAAGWEVAGIAPVTLALPGMAPFAVNRVVIRKGLDRQLVYYWFEGRGRRMTSAFAAKFLTLADGALLGRTDGGLVRVITPIDPSVGPSVDSSVDSGRGGEPAADARLRRFLGAGTPLLDRFVPDRDRQPIGSPINDPA